MDDQPQDQTNEDNGASPAPTPSLRKTLSKEERLKLEVLFSAIFGNRNSFKRKMNDFQKDFKEKQWGWSESTWGNVWDQLTKEDGPGRIDPQTKIDLILFFLRDAAPSERQEDTKIALGILSKLNDRLELKERLLHLKSCAEDRTIISPPRTFTVKSGDVVGRAIRSENESSVWQGENGVKAIAPVWADDSFHREFASFHCSPEGWSVTYLEGKVLGLTVSGEKMRAGYTRPIQHNDMITFAGEWHFLIQDDDRLGKEYRKS